VLVDDLANLPYLLPRRQPRERRITDSGKGAKGGRPRRRSQLQVCDW
jgi:hypothetical protein